MATRSMIGYWNPQNGNVTAIYCHHDGYPAGVGRMLENCWGSDFDVQDLMGLGSISVLDEDLLQTIAYHRDRGEKELRISYYPSPEAYRAAFGDGGDEYRYLWDGEAWFVMGYLGKDKNDRRWHDLEVVLKEEGEKC